MASMSWNLLCTLSVINQVKLIIFTGWETSEIVDVIHDIKHMMGDVLFRLVLEMVAFRPSRAKFPCCCRLQVCHSHSSWQWWLPRLQSNALYGLACELPYSRRRWFLTFNLVHFRVLWYEIHNRNLQMQMAMQLEEMLSPRSVAWWQMIWDLHSRSRVRVRTCISCKSLGQPGFYSLT
jgi:hypothetical protein